MVSRRIFATILAGVAFSTIPCMADTLTVHSTSGPYNSVNAALAAANPGDIIEITDNTTTFSENLYITKDDITIQGQTGLDPQPLIEGVLAPHPLAGSTDAPQKWWWTAGDPNSAVTIFDEKGAVVVNAASGLTLRNLHIKCEPTSSTTGNSTSGLLDFRFGTDGLVEDCYLNGSGLNTQNVEIAGADRASLTANNHTFRNCTFYRGNVTLEHHGGTGTLRIEDCVLTAPVHTLYLFGGDVEIENTQFHYQRATGASRVIEVGNAFGSANVRISNSFIRKLLPGSTNDQFIHLRLDDRGAAFGADDYNTGRWATGEIEIEVDNCDLIANPIGTVSRIVDVNNDRVNWVVKKLAFTDNNIYGVSGTLYSLNTTIPYMGNEYKGSGSQLLFEDYNAFKLTLDTTAFSRFTSGGNSVFLDAGQALYVDPANQDYQLAANSPAATLNSTGTPAYTGSTGVSATSVPDSIITVGHTGADYTSVQAALTAASAGTLIQIIDNSAPYVENIDILTAMGVTLQGSPSLNPHPTIQSNGIPKPFLLSTTVHSITLRNLILNSASTAGTNSTVFENMRPGTVTALTNVKLVGGGATLYNVVQDQSNLVMTNCEIVMPNPGRPAILKRRAGVCALTNCLVTAADRAVEHYSGKLLLRNSQLHSSAGPVIVVPHNATYSGTMMLEFYDSLIRSTAFSGSNPLIRLDSSTTRRSFLFDNCDLIGSASGVTPELVNILTPLNYAHVVDTIHTNATSTAYNLNTNTSAVTIPGLTFDPLANWEDYNVYKNAPNTLNTQGGVRGPNNVYLGPTDSLYTYPEGNDFRLRPSSQATTLNSTGTPAYAGSQGIGTEGPTSVDADWELYH